MPAYETGVQDLYSERFKQLVAELPNSGPLQGATHVGEAANPVCGDASQVLLRIERQIVAAAHFRATGCAAAIACSAAITLMVRDQTVESCRKITSGDIIEFLGGLPRHKMHGAELALDALSRALQDSGTER